MKRRVLLFIFCLMSLIGLMIGWSEEYSSYSFDITDLLQVWFPFSLPLIILLIYMVCFPRKTDELVWKHVIRMYNLLGDNNFERIGVIFMSAAILYTAYFFIFLGGTY
jgi:hypothetical protein